MTDHTRTALLQAIIDDPADDLPRLAYADYLEENGHDAHAEFIRVQLLLAKTKSECGSESGGYLCRSMIFCPLCPLIRRQNSAWLEISLDYFSRTRIPLRGFACTIFAGPDHPPPVVHIRRGFVESVQCTHYQWLEHGPTIARVNPVERVTLHGFDIQRGYRESYRLPYRSDCSPSSPRIVYQIHPGFDEYSKQSDLVEFVGRAALAWAKRLVK